MADELDIVKYPDPILRKQAVNVPKVDAETKRLIDDMFVTMRATNGLGLAANQIGSLNKVFVYDDGSGPGVLLNPKITSATGTQVGTEGCLSIPGLQGDVRRANHIEVTGTDLKGKTVKIKARGLLARIFQHEIDHLNGTLFIDKAEPSSLYYVSEEDEAEEE